MGEKLSRIIKRIKSPFAIFLSKKIVFLIVAIFIAFSVVFIFTHLMPSNPADVMMTRIARGTGGAGGVGTTGSEAGGATSRIAVLRDIYYEKFGVGESMLTKYSVFWKRFITMDYGKSYWRWPLSVSRVILHAFPWTMALILPVIPIGFVVGNYIGSRSAYYGGKLDNLAYIISNYLVRAPYYWIAMILITIFGVQLGWFPIGGPYGDEFMGPSFSLDWFASALYHWALPFLSLVPLGIGGWAVGMRAMTLYEMESDYLIFSKQLGFSEDSLRSDAERNAILPNFTSLPMVFRGLISQTLLVEIVFGYPGLGSLLYYSVFNQDYPLLEAAFVITILIVLVGNFVIDILYGIIDPRIATGYVGGE